MRPLNNILVCKDLSKNQNTQSTTGFVVKNEERFKTLEVLYSSQEDIPVGEKVRVSINAGEDDGEVTYIRRTDIIVVL